MGDAPTLLLLPGLGLGEESWAPSLTRLGHTGAALVPRLPGYGSRAPTGADLRPRALAASAIGGVSAGSGRLVVFGHSASCQIAAHVAALARERVAALVLVGPTTDPRAATWPRLAGRWLATARHETPRQVPTLVRQYRRTTLRSMLRAMDVARGDSVQQTLREAGLPVLVVRGRFDRICPEDWASTVAYSGGAGSRAVTLRAGGHMVPLTHGQWVAPVVRDFLADQLGPDPAGDDDPPSER